MFSLYKHFESNQHLRSYIDEKFGDSNMISNRATPMSHVELFFCVFVPQKTWLYEEVSWSGKYDEEFT